MDLAKVLNDDRLLANLISIHIVLGVLVLVSIILRKLLKNGREQISSWTGLAWFDGVSQEAVKGMRAMLFWTTVSLMIISVASMAVYHVAGRDARSDFQDLSGQITLTQLTGFGIALGKLVALAIGVALVFRLI